MLYKKVIVCDLDGTLTQSKSPLSLEMAEVISLVLKKHFFVVISGGAFQQFEKQFLSYLKCPKEDLENLIIFPTMGGSCFMYDAKQEKWNKLYEEKLTDKEINKIFSAFEKAIKKLKLDLSGNYGAILENRETQVTFSGRGQNAPIGEKEKWDPDQSKRRSIIKILEKEIPEFDLKLGGISSIDVTKKGINKAYAIERLKKILNLKDDEIIFLGDALYRGGNDESVKTTGVDFIQESGPEETLGFLSQYM